MQEPYSAAIRWDEEAGVWYVSETNFPGLVAEAETRHGLVEKIRQLTPELHDANGHLMRMHSRGEEVVIQLMTELKGDHLAGHRELRCGDALLRRGEATTPRRMGHGGRTSLPPCATTHVRYSACLAQRGAR